jgi:hypothetical protein
MNKRIRELMEQASSNACYDEPGQLHLMNDEIEKFAELIVEECRTVINDLYHRMPLQLAVVLIDADNEIMKHFYGVKK